MLKTRYGAEPAECRKQCRIDEEQLQQLPGESAELVALALDGFGPGFPPPAPEGRIFMNLLNSSGGS